MTTNERIQEGLQQAKDEVSELRSDAERKVAEAKIDAKGFVETERAKDGSVVDRVADQIATSEAAMDEYYTRRDETGLI